MMYKQLILVIVVLLSGEASAQVRDRLVDSVYVPIPKAKILARVDELKTLIGKKYWPTFDNPEYSMEMNYYEEGPFRMHLVQDGNNKPRMECSSPEITFKSVPGVKLYEEWYAMLIHEFFHAFQHTKYPAFWNKMIEVNPENFYANDSLMALKHYDWYKELLVRENSLLPKMYAATSIDELRQLFKQFLSLRNERLRLVKEKLGLDITLFYPFTETNEGSARYIEYCLYKEQGLTNTEWMLDLNGHYFYASGLYLLLIMDKFGIEYKNELFDKYFTITDLLSAKL